MNPTSIQATISLSNGVQMPMLGLGTWQTPDGETASQAVRWAIELGYRHIDTAAIYGNEKGVGEGVRSSGVKREKIFVTTKVWNDAQRAGYDAVLSAFDESLARLQFDYVDLYLVHWPVKGKYKEAWRAMEKIYADGRAKAIGVSNFLQHHLDDLLPDAQIVPQVDQIELHPWLQQKSLTEYSVKHRIVQTAWSPLMQGKIDDVPELKRIARQYGKSAAQVALRWNIQHGIVTIPKSVRRERIAENANLEDFVLTSEDMQTIDGLDCHKRLGADPDNFSF